MLGCISPDQKPPNTSNIIAIKNCDPTVSFQLCTNDLCWRPNRYVAICGSQTSLTDTAIYIRIKTD